MQTKNNLTIQNYFIIAREINWKNKWQNKISVIVERRDFSHSASICWNPKKAKRAHLLVQDVAQTHTYIEMTEQSWAFIKLYNGHGYKHIS